MAARQPGLQLLASSSPERTPCDCAALETSLNQIVRRHDVLRTFFPASDGLPVQRVRPALQVSLVCTDLRAINRRSIAEATRQMVDESSFPTIWRRAPLPCGAMDGCDDDDHLLMIAVHHIVFDGWSKSLLLHELGALYSQIVDGTPTALAPLPLQYADYARREAASTRSIDRHLEFWTRHLARLPIAELPSDGVRGDEIDSRGREQARRFDRR